MKYSEIIVTKLRARAVNAPLEIPIQTAVGTVATAPLVLIDIETNANVKGSAWLFAYTPLCLKALLSCVANLASFVEGKTLAPVSIAQNIDNAFLLVGHTGLLRMASSGIDMALWDAHAKAVGLPLVRMLGGLPQAINAYDSHSMDGAALASERARKSMEEGFTSVKTKIGYSTVDQDLEVIQAIKDATSDRIKVMVDYNQSLNVPEAISRIRLLSQAGVEWVEEPTRQYDYSGHAKITAASVSPVQMGENWLGTDEMKKCLHAGACDLAMVDIMKIGGVTGWLKAAAIAEEFSIPLSSHLFQEFSAHLLCVSPTADRLERMDIASTILDSSLIFIDGKAVPSDEHGAGFVWKESEIEKYEI